jgi:hypothetical protein
VALSAPESVIGCGPAPDVRRSTGERDRVAVSMPGRRLFYADAIEL